MRRPPPPPSRTTDRSFHNTRTSRPPTHTHLADAVLEEGQQRVKEALSVQHAYGLLMEPKLLPSDNLHGQQRQGNDDDVDTSAAATYPHGLLTRSKDEREGEIRVQFVKQPPVWLALPGS